jgi:Ran GTPase-activating protein (RanGAP) involved in mRNA processing and transport
MTEVEEPHDFPANIGCLQAAAHYGQTFRERVGWIWTQIADVLRKGLPKLNENDNAFTAALEVVPAEDWCRTWAAGRTIMLRRTSKRVKEVVDKMRLPAVVRLSRSFWDDARNGTAAEKLQFVMRQLAVATATSRISTLELRYCDMKGQDAERLAEVLAQCQALAHLDLQCNWNFEGGAARLGGVLAQCSALAHLNLFGNQIRPAGAESLAGVLAQCAALAHLDLGLNNIGPDGAERLAGVLPQCTVLAHLNLRYNDIGTVGGGRLRASWRGQASGLRL